MTAPGGGEVRSLLRTALAGTTERLGEAGVPSPSADARALISHAARTDAPLVMLDVLPETFAEDLEQLTARRERREPLQLILGRAPFRHLLLQVRPGVFIPRPETELAIDLLAQHGRATGADPALVVDLCTGSGALAAAVLDEFPAAEVVAVDVDPAAIELARTNLEAAGAGRGRVLQADLSHPTAPAGIGPADAILANPPYVPPDAIPREQEVRDHDPERALYGGGRDGMELPRAVVRWAARLLRPGGVLIMEHADVQGAATRALADASGGFDEMRTAPDLTGRDRFLVARRATGAARDGSETLSR